MGLCNVCSSLDPETITEDESCRLQDWDRMEVIAGEGCEGCKFFWQIINTYTGDDDEYSWGRIRLMDPRPTRFASAVQALVVEGCGSCAKLLAAINGKTHFKPDNWEDWDACDEDEGSHVSQHETPDLDDLARDGCAGCQALLAEGKTKAVCLVQHTSRAQKLGFSMLVDGYEGRRAVKYLLDICSITELGLTTQIKVSTDTVSNIFLDEISSNRLISQYPGVAVPKLWLHRCSSHHECPSQDVVLLPTRVIDVGTTSKPNVCLHVADGEYGKYVALSHCWGTSKMVKTTLEVLDRFQDSIDFETLPRNFRDAITLTRDMGFRFIWIDSLCIIQDSSEDWAQESAKMAFIYAQATITIAAMAATDSEGGILRPRNASHSHRLNHQDNLVFRQKATSWNQVNNLPLSRRAWTLQEQHLSRRTLYFTDEQMYWECDTLVYAEFYRLPETVTESAQKQRIMGLAKMASDYVLGVSVDQNNLLDLYQRYLAWYTLVKDYSHRELTYVSDKLPAISGLAQVIGASDPRVGDFMAGLWKSDLLRGLKWMTGYTGVGFDARDPPSLKRNMVYTGPSWSWSAYSGPISYHGTCQLDSTIHDAEFYEKTFSIADFRGDETNEQAQHPEGDTRLQGLLQYRTYLVEQKIDLATKFEYGEVLPGCYIVLSGLTRQIFVHLSSGLARPESSDVQVSESCFFDTEKYGWDSEKNHKWYWNRPKGLNIETKQFLALQISANTKTGGIFTMILQPVPKDLSFERVGFTNIGNGFPWEKDGKPQGWDPEQWKRREVKLV